MEATSSAPASPRSGPAALLRRYASVLLLILAALVGLAALPPAFGDASQSGPLVFGRVPAFSLAWLGTALVLCIVVIATGASVVRGLDAGTRRLLGGSAESSASVPNNAHRGAGRAAFDAPGTGARIVGGLFDLVILLVVQAVVRTPLVRVASLYASRQWIDAGFVSLIVLLVLLMLIRLRQASRPLIEHLVWNGLDALAPTAGFQGGTITAEGVTRAAGAPKPKPVATSRPTPAAPRPTAPPAKSPAQPTPAPAGPATAPEAGEATQVSGVSAPPEVVAAAAQSPAESTVVAASAIAPSRAPEADVEATRLPEPTASSPAVPVAPASNEPADVTIVGAPPVVPLAAPVDSTIVAPAAPPVAQPDAPAQSLPTVDVTIVGSAAEPPVTPSEIAPTPPVEETISAPIEATPPANPAPVAELQDARSQDARSQDAQSQDAQSQDAQSQDAQSQDAQSQDAQSIEATVVGVPAAARPGEPRPVTPSIEPTAPPEATLVDLVDLATSHPVEVNTTGIPASKPDDTAEATMVEPPTNAPAGPLGAANGSPTEATPGSSEATMVGLPFSKPVESPEATFVGIPAGADSSDATMVESAGASGSTIVAGPVAAASRAFPPKPAPSAEPPKPARSAFLFPRAKPTAAPTVSSALSDATLADATIVEPSPPTGPVTPAPAPKPTPAQPSARPGPAAPAPTPARAAPGASPARPVSAAPPTPPQARPASPSFGWLDGARRRVPTPPTRPADTTDQTLPAADAPPDLTDRTVVEPDDLTATRPAAPSPVADEPAADRTLPGGG